MLLFKLLSVIIVHFLDGFKIWKADNRAYYETYFKQFEKSLNLFKLYSSFITNIKTNIGIIFL